MCVCVCVCVCVPTATQAFGRTTLEAAARGTPVIGRDSGAVRELIYGGRPQQRRQQPAAGRKAKTTAAAAASTTTTTDVGQSSTEDRAALGVVCPGDDASIVECFSAALDQVFAGQADVGIPTTTTTTAANSKKVKSGKSTKYDSMPMFSRANVAARAQARFSATMEVDGLLRQTLLLEQQMQLIRMPVSSLSLIHI